MHSKGIELIAAERRRQIEQVGYTAEHDAQWKSGELAMAAAAYALPSVMLGTKAMIWPWDRDSYKPKHRILDLMRAGALIAAEIDRLLAQRTTAEADAVLQIASRYPGYRLVPDEVAEKVLPIVQAMVEQKRIAAEALIGQEERVQAFEEHQALAALAAALRGSDSGC